MATAQLKHLPVTLTDGDDYEVAYWQVESGKPGPSVLVTAALHAHELHGSEIIREFLPLAEAELQQGRCMLMPFANPEAARRGVPHIDFDPGQQSSGNPAVNANAGWPGDPDGTNSQRLDHALFNSVIPEATHLIDFHSWQRRKGAAAIVTTGDRASMDLVNAAAPPFAYHKEYKPEIKERPVFPCNLRNYFSDTGRPAVTVEFSGQYGFWHDQFIIGGRFIRNAFRHLEMLPGELEKPERPTIWEHECDAVDVAAPVPGVFVQEPLAVGATLKEGDPLGHIVSLETLDAVEVTAPANGTLYVFGVMHDRSQAQGRGCYHPHVQAGEILATILHPKDT